MMLDLRKELEARATRLDGGCLEWRLSLTKEGYGQTSKTRYGEGIAHRAAWKAAKGEIPAGRKVKHFCGNTACIEPDHLYLDSPLDKAGAVATARAWRAANPDRVLRIKHNYRLRNKDKAKAYAATVVKERLRAKTEALATRPRPEFCEVCGERENKRAKVLHFDHCHATGKFRGWLCGRCNMTLGQVRDDDALLLKLIGYLASGAE